MHIVICVFTEYKESDADESSDGDEKSQCSSDDDDHHKYR